MTEALAVLIILGAIGALVYRLRQAVKRKRGEGGSGGPHDGRPRQLDHDVRPERDAVHRELVQAATSIGRALHLIGADWYTATGTGNTDWKQDSV